MKVSTRIIAAVLLVAGSSGAVYAFSKHSDWGMTTEEKVEFISDRVTHKLDLDAIQREKFAELAEMVVVTFQEVKPTRGQHFAELNSLLQEPSFNQARALEMIQQKTQLMNERAPLVISSLAGFLDSLSFEQKQQLQEFMQHRFENRRHEHHRPDR
jgi:Spy/CpxP family protein refolding chaperone